MRSNNNFDFLLSFFLNLQNYATNFRILFAALFKMTRNIICNYNCKRIGDDLEHKQPVRDDDSFLIKLLTEIF